MSGMPVIIFDDLNGNIGYLMDLAINASPETVNFMIKKAKGLVYVCIPEQLALQLQLPSMKEYPFHHSSKDFTVSVDYKTTTTGISAHERSDTIKAFLDPSTTDDDFKRPGHVFPLISHGIRSGKEFGIAEAAVSLAQLSCNESIAYVCEILNVRGEVADWPELQQFSQQYGLNIISMSDILLMRSRPQMKGAAIG
ncbi:3,4-dihydroxy-2-butanone-4-phosphate synthase [Ammoniphilus sp. YIM 78166]|uniref:3,4-dihydroxy-2-butanone-4-phosphate synthase n=1 Tax=Ammoniphilus sp. YIM 78166 TaxID=1644106 RepID=UPI00106FE32A|nr:3,4-dihydroxy-2-butanone-4-phosphate synthase [Ammoniphilus sp. YIM 78166]